MIWVLIYVLGFLIQVGFGIGRDWESGEGFVAALLWPLFLPIGIGSMLGNLSVVNGGK